MEDRRPEERRNDYQSDHRLTKNQQKAFTEIAERNSTVEILSREKGLQEGLGGKITIGRIEVVGETTRSSRNTMAQK